MLHLSPEHESHLAEVLQVSARIPVVRATETLLVEPDHVYVISPNTSLRMADGHLTVSDTRQVDERRSPVDIFFRTLADTHGARAVSIVLSGTGPDGSSGLKRVKEHGGVIMAQEPRESDHDDMPRNAIGTGLVDHILPVGEMASRIVALARHLGPVRRRDPLSRSTGLDGLPEIMTLVRLRTGHDFSHYKTATVLRRIARRQHLHDLPDTGAYARFLREHQEEVQALQRELLISVTQFFRDPDAFAALERHVLPRLFHDKFAQDQVRVWVAGCATGEEAYSIAMLLAEAAAAVERPAVASGVRDRSGRVRHRRRARGLLHGSGSGGRVAGAAAPVLRSRAGRVPGAARPARDRALRAPQRAQGPAVLAPRPRLLPQPPDLLEP